MTVYVDDMYKSEMGRYGRMKMSHMMADTLPELHEMAAMIGVSRKWFQDKPRHPHYDVSISKRNYAVLRGAKQITMAEIVKIVTSTTANTNGVIKTIMPDKDGE